MNENLSQWFARVFLGEMYGRSTSKRIADNLGGSVDIVHFLMVLGIAACFGSRK